MEIVSEYSDEGKSGKSVEGRPEFQRMLDNAENGIDEVQPVSYTHLSQTTRAICLCESISHLFDTQSLSAVTCTNPSQPTFL